MLSFAALYAPNPSLLILCAFRNSLLHSRRQDRQSHVVRPHSGGYLSAARDALYLVKRMRSPKLRCAEFWSRNSGRDSSQLNKLFEVEAPEQVLSQLRQGLGYTPAYPHRLHTHLGNIYSITPPEDHVKTSTTKKLSVHRCFTATSSTLGVRVVPQTRRQSRLSTVLAERQSIISYKLLSCH